MKIKMVAAHGGPVLKNSSQVMKLKVEGPIDMTNSTLQKARALAVKSGSQEMIDAFDWAVATGALASDE